MAKRVLIIDDDAVTRVLMNRILEVEGYELREMESADGLEVMIQDFAPDAILCDILMPGQDGLSVCRALHSDPKTRSIQVILVSAKSFEADKRRAMDAGAVGYLVKPLHRADLVKAVREALASDVGVKVWGCRGSIPAPEKAQGLYGGNTPCMTLMLPGNRHLIFDAGTGIRALGEEVIGPAPMQFHICLTHFHWDHIQGLPFFAPIYVPGNEISIYGPAESNDALAEKMAGQMGQDYFPLSIRSLQSSMNYTALGEQTFEILDVSISTFHAFHPGSTLAYRIAWGDRSVVYAPDNELLPESVEPELSGEALRFAEFASGASLLIHDCTFSNEVCKQRRGWGHSCGETLAAVAAHAGVERLLLFHHDPGNNDEDVQAIHQEFQSALSGVAIDSEPAQEGATYPL